MATKADFPKLVCACGCQTEFAPVRAHQKYLTPQHRASHWREQHTPTEEKQKALIREHLLHLLEHDHDVSVQVAGLIAKYLGGVKTQPDLVENLAEQLSRQPKDDGEVSTGEGQPHP